jgi:hypothetical protein
VKRRAFRVEITGKGPVMTKEGNIQPYLRSAEASTGST